MRNFDDPRQWLVQFELPVEVVSCASAAAAKGVSLERELKSLLLNTEGGMVMVHIRGNRKLSLRAVKRQLQVNQAHLSSAHELAALDIEPGTVHPFDPALKRLPQLLSREVLALDWVTTNAGRLDRYVVFDPVILQRAPVCVVGDFEVI